ncbi:uncharacterized protein METZ01_LOCUS53460 [marine metagenome]|uniref:Uncharacterized protein n=1 Tax=marine metagenome TaxID=408172 RepID=A0A381S998_9ZZZZ
MFPSITWFAPVTSKVLEETPKTSNRARIWNIRRHHIGYDAEIILQRSRSQRERPATRFGEERTFAHTTPIILQIFYYKR